MGQTICSFCGFKEELQQATAFVEISLPDQSSQQPPSSASLFDGQLSGQGGESWTIESSLPDQSQPPGGSGGGGMGGVGVGMVGVVPTPLPRVRKVCTITDKHGNVIDLSSGKTVVTAKSEAGATKPVEAGAALRRAAEEAIAAASAKNKKTREEAGKKEKAEREAEEECFAAERCVLEETKAKEEPERLEDERKRLAREESKARKEAEERARKEFEDRQRKEAEAQQAAAATPPPKEAAPIRPSTTPAPSSGFRPGCNLRRNAVTCLV